MVDKGDVNLQLESAQDIDYGDLVNDLVDNSEIVAKNPKSRDRRDGSNDDFNKSLDDLVKEDKPRHQQPAQNLKKHTQNRQAQNSHYDRPQKNNRSQPIPRLVYFKIISCLGITEMSLPKVK